MASDENEDETPEDVSVGDVARTAEAADPEWLIEKYIPEDLRKKYEFYSYRSAVTILAVSHPEHFAELCQALREFQITKTMIRTAGGNESEIPKLLSASLRPKGWKETTIQGDLVVKLISHDKTPDRNGSTKTVREIRRPRYLDGHKVDYVKDRVAFDLEWNSKDQTFDRDLYAFSAFAQCGVVDVGVLVTRGLSMTEFIKGLGHSLDKKGNPEVTKAGVARPVSTKYGASTTWMGKLLYRLNAGRNGACPVLAIGITPQAVVD